MNPSVPLRTGVEKTTPVLAVGTVWGSRTMDAFFVACELVRLIQTGELDVADKAGIAAKRTDLLSTWQHNIDVNTMSDIN